MCIYQEYMCIYLQDMKFLWLILLLGQLYTDDINDNANNDDGRQRRWHTTDKSRLHRLIGMYAKWAKNQTIAYLT